MTGITKSLTRRTFLHALSFAASLPIIGRRLAVGLEARETVCLEGTWIVRCPRGHDDQVDDITCNHDCEKCGLKSVDGGTADVVCPDGHATRVGGVTRTHSCTFPLPGGGICGKQCRR
jgi:hypothetical protein